MLPEKPVVCSRMKPVALVMWLKLGMSAVTTRSRTQFIASRRGTRRLLLCALLLVLVGLNQAATPAIQPLRALPPGELPKDRRLGPLKDLDGYFPFAPRRTPADWNARAAHVRLGLSVALGLWPMPEKTPLHAAIHGRIEQPDYTVEKVYFESLPGFFVTGNLYRPKGRTGKLPGVLSPHGHWSNGRFLDSGPEEVKQEIARGAEKFAEGGRSVLQSRCVQLARMGCVVFHYDMIGYADCAQIPLEVAHGFAKQRPDMNAPGAWGLFSPRAEGRLQSVMGWQTWNSIRALDFLLSLPDVDAQRIGVTGASGGGTQTFILGALDDRPAVAFPAVMVGTAMQGGCTCENACLLRVDTGNVEIAALFAPKPLGMTAADDWTKEMPTKGFPELQKLFTMLGSPDHVQLTPRLQFPHNYNYVSRAAMYEWLNEHLRLGLPSPIVEQDYHRLSARELTVWDQDHPRPEGGAAFEQRLLQWITRRDEQNLAASQGSLEDFRKVYGPALEVIIGRNLSSAGKVAFQQTQTKEEAGFTVEAGLLSNKTYGEEIPVLRVKPKRGGTCTVIWVDGEGKSGWWEQDRDQGLQPIPAVRKLLESGVTVIGADLLYQGEFMADGKPLARARRVNNPREAAAYTFGYNRTLFAQRVHDLLSLIQWARTDGGARPQIDLVGMNGGAAWVAAARALAGDAVTCAAMDTQGFRFEEVSDIFDVNFLPGAAKYGDLPGMLALGAPGKLWLAGEGSEAPELLQKIYRVAHSTGRITLAENAAAPGEAAAAWLLKQFSN